MGNQLEGPYVRFGSKADICSAPTHVRFTPNSDIDCVFRHVRYAPKSGHQVLNQMQERHGHAYDKQGDANSQGN
jgi:hypothetical protein